MSRYLCLLLVLMTSLSCDGGGGTGPGPGPGPGPNPIDVASTADAGRAVTAFMPRSGGTITATAADGTTLELIVPAGGLANADELTLTPLSGVTGLPLAGGLLAGVEVTPAELDFALPATLRITPPAPLNPTQVHGFAISDPAPSGAGVRALALSGEYSGYPSEAADPEGDSAPAMTLALSSAGVYGLGRGEGGEDHLPSARDALRTARLAALLDTARQTGIPLSDPTLRAALIALFDADLPSITAECPAAAADLGALSTARQSFNRWHQQVQLTGLESEYAAEIGAALDCLAEGYYSGLQALAAEPCTPEKAITLLRLAQVIHDNRLVNRGSAGPTDADLLALISPCARFALDIDETFTTHDAGNRYAVRYTTFIVLLPDASFDLTGKAIWVFTSGTTEFGDTGCCVVEMLPVRSDFCIVERLSPPHPGRPNTPWSMEFSVNETHADAPVESLRFNCTACDPPTDQQVQNSYWLLPFLTFYKSQEFLGTTNYLLRDWTSGTGNVLVQRHLNRSAQPGGPGLTFDEVGRWALEHFPE